LLDALALKLPASQRLEIERRLREAVMSENYELAAILRNELRMMEGGA
jgi:protein-arginine kinase activator protein McsA